MLLLFLAIILPGGDHIRKAVMPDGPSVRNSEFNHLIQAVSVVRVHLSLLKLHVVIAEGEELRKWSVPSRADLSFVGLELIQFCGSSLRKIHKIRNKSKNFK